MVAPLVGALARAAVGLAAKKVAKTASKEAVKKTSSKALNKADKKQQDREDVRDNIAEYNYGKSWEVPKPKSKGDSAMDNRMVKRAATRKKTSEGYDGVRFSDSEIPF
jgi:hypothetical protein